MLSIYLYFSFLASSSSVLTCDSLLSFLPSHGRASSFLPKCSHHWAEEEGSWSLLLECIIRFNMWKLFSWRPVPGGLQQLSPADIEGLWGPFNPPTCVSSFSLTSAEQGWPAFSFCSPRAVVPQNLPFCRDSEWKQGAINPTELTTDHQQVSSLSGSSQVSLSAMQGSRGEMWAGKAPTFSWIGMLFKLRWL